MVSHEILETIIRVDRRMSYTGSLYFLEDGMQRQSVNMKNLYRCFPDERAFRTSQEPETSQRFDRL